MQNRVWNRLSGGEALECYPFLRKPGVSCSNSFVIRGHGQVIVIDPGGLPEQTGDLLPLVRECSNAAGLPVWIYLTHCHVDHCLEIVNNPLWRAVAGVTVVLHEDGARALRTQDRELTQANLLCVELQKFQAEIVTPSFGNPASERRALLGPEGVLELHHTPGHSPDSLCLRLGDLLFVGDLLAATAPLIAGVAGWDPAVLKHSVDRVVSLLEANPSLSVCPGHGPIMDRDSALRKFRRVAQEALVCGPVSLVDAGRAKLLSQEAQELFEELGQLFQRIDDRLGLLASRLENLEESSASQEIRTILDADAVTRLLADFRNFNEEYRAGNAVDVQLALKAVQVLKSISGLIAYEQLARLLDPVLLRTTRRSLDDFQTAAKGLKLEGPRDEVALRSWAAAVVGEATAEPGRGVSLLDIPSDEAGFRDYLVARLAHVPLFAGVVVAVDSGGDDVLVWAVASRLHDAVRWALEELAAAGAKRISLAAVQDATGPALAIRGEEGLQLHLLSEQSIRPLRRMVVRAGASLSVQYAAHRAEFTLRFPRRERPR